MITTILYTKPKAKYDIEVIYIMNSLDKVFTHKILYHGTRWTMRDFLELCAENKDCYMALKTTFKSQQLFAEPEHHSELRFLDCNCRVKLNDEQADYFNERKRFWNQWHNNFSDKNFHGEYDNEYINLEKQEKMKINEYANAIRKLKY